MIYLSSKNEGLASMFQRLFLWFARSLSHTDRLRHLTLVIHFFACVCLSISCTNKKERGAGDIVLRLCFVLFVCLWARRKRALSAGSVMFSCVFPHFGTALCACGASLQ